MGYSIHITRADEWSESEARPIPLEQWCEFVRGDSDLRLEPVARARNPQTGVLVEIDTPGGAVWLAHPDGDPIRFHYSRGKISVKSPDDHTLAKMKQIAARFGARVRGDEGEEYG